MSSSMPTEDAVLEDLDDEMLALVIADWLISEPARARRLLEAFKRLRAKLAAGKS